jgi:hypothetical protein
MARAARPSTGRRIRPAITGAVAATALTVGTAAALPPIQGAMPATASSPRTPVDVPGAPSSSAGGINDRGQIVGSYGNPAAMPPSPQVAGVRTPTRMS